MKLSYAFASSLAPGVSQQCNQLFERKDLTIYSAVWSLPKPCYQPEIALVDCLKDLHSEAYEFETAFRETGRAYRTPHYSNALISIIRMLRYSEYDGTIFSWLESYPFGGYSTLKDKRQSILKLLSEEYCHEPMYAVMVFACRIDFTPHQLLESNLVDLETVERCRETLYIPPEHLGIVRDDGDFSHRGNITKLEECACIGYWTSEPTSGETLEDRLARRRRREIVVFGEVGRPFAEEDIFVPTYHDETGTPPPDLDLSPNQIQVLEDGDQVTATDGEIVSRPLTPESASEGSNSV